MTMGGLWWAISVRSNWKFFAYFIDFFDDLRPAFDTSMYVNADLTTVSTAWVVGSVR